MNMKWKKGNKRSSYTRNDACPDEFAEVGGTTNVIIDRQSHRYSGDEIWQGGEVKKAYRQNPPKAEKNLKNSKNSANLHRLWRWTKTHSPPASVKPE